MSTKIIPTDKSGQVYYGPTTLAAARQRVDDLRDDGMEGAARMVVDDLSEAGYPRLAALIRREYGVVTH